MGEGGVQQAKQPQAKLAYENILFNAMNKCVMARSDDPYRRYPLAVEALILALPEYADIERKVLEYKYGGGWDNERREIERNESDTRKIKMKAYDKLFLKVKHLLESHNLLLKFKTTPVGGGYG